MGGFGGAGVTDVTRSAHTSIAVAAARAYPGPIEQQQRHHGPIRRAGRSIRHRTGRAREAARRRRTLDFAWRSAVLVLGLVLVIGGIVLLPLPGPGWLVIFLGLGLLATEFSWAARVLHEARHRYELAKRRARRGRERGEPDPERRKESV